MFKQYCVRWRSACNTIFNGNFSLKHVLCSVIITTKYTTLHKIIFYSVERWTHVHCTQNTIHHIASWNSQSSVFCMLKESHNTTVVHVCGVRCRNSQVYCVWLHVYSTALTLSPTPRQCISVRVFSVYIKYSVYIALF